MKREQRKKMLAGRDSAGAKCQSRIVAFKSSSAGEWNVSVVVGPGEAIELGKGQVMNHLLKGICL